MFPTNPVNGQTYSDYKYNATKSAWEKNVNGDLELNGSIIMGKYKIVYNSQTDTLDTEYIA